MLGLPETHKPKYAHSFFIWTWNTPDSYFTEHEYTQPVCNPLTWIWKAYC